jgi:hypothetical protein
VMMMGAARVLVAGDCNTRWARLLMLVEAAPAACACY